MSWPHTKLYPQKVSSGNAKKSGSIIIIIITNNNNDKRKDPHLHRWRSIIITRRLSIVNWQLKKSDLHLCPTFHLPLFHQNVKLKGVRSQSMEQERITILMLCIHPVPLLTRNLWGWSLFIWYRSQMGDYVGHTYVANSGRHANGSTPTISLTLPAYNSHSLVLPSSEHTCYHNIINWWSLIIYLSLRRKFTQILGGSKQKTILCLYVVKVQELCQKWMYF